jgi:hypothetical protein
LVAAIGNDPPTKVLLPRLFVHHAWRSAEDYFQRRPTTEQLPVHQRSSSREGAVNEQQAIEAAKQAGVAEGSYITLQSDGQIMHPHGPDDHVDAWRVENIGGNYVATKIHSTG